jgi:hypothetical protein
MRPASSRAAICPIAATGTATSTAHDNATIRELAVITGALVHTFHRNYLVCRTGCQRNKREPTRLMHCY